jgi:ATP phosphoribosyltransferase regulatory subunit
VQPVAPVPVWKVPAAQFEHALAAVAAVMLWFWVSAYVVLLGAELNPVTDADVAPQSRLAGLLSGLGEAEAVALLEEVWSLAGVSPVGGRPTAQIARRLAARGGEGARARLTEDQIGRVRASWESARARPAARTSLVAS